MANSPKDIEEKILKILNAWKTIAPTKTFGGLTVAQFETRVEKSLAPRRRLEQLDNEKTEQKALRESEDEITLRDAQFVINGVLADPDYGDDSALYEAFGYVRKSEKKSGLTRKKTEPKTV